MDIKRKIPVNFTGICYLENQLFPNQIQISDGHIDMDRDQRSGCAGLVNVVFHCPGAGQVGVPHFAIDRDLSPRVIRDDDLDVTHAAVDGNIRFCFVRTREIECVVAHTTVKFDPLLTMALPRPYNSMLDAPVL